MVSMTAFGRRLALHSATHEDGGIDEIDATDLEGLINYVDRGDPSAWDFELGDLVTDGTWNDLDLSSIIPSGNILVHFYAAINDDAISSYIQFRQKGNVKAVNVSTRRTQVSGIYNDLNFFVMAGVNKLIQYRTTITTFSYIVISIRGWFV
jgi:hypothetical protein